MSEIGVTEDQLVAQTGRLTSAVIDELIALRTSARLAAEDFTTAVADQSNKAGISKSALRRYICAREADKIDSLDAEAEDLAMLLEGTS